MESFYKRMLSIRRFEERVLELFSRGELFGTTHTSIGQEAGAVAVIDHLKHGDFIVSGHRCHGHYLAWTVDYAGLFGELMGRAGGVVGGRGGSQHLHAEGFYTNGVLGNMVPVAAGMAMAEKRRGEGAIGVLFLGDGAMGEGTVYETLNMLSLWQLPLLVVVENNCYAQTTPLDLHFAGSFSGRAKAFGVDTGEIESNDVRELHSHFESIVKKVRGTSAPHMEIVHTYRLCAHSKGDDFRPAEEIETWRRRDPLRIEAARLDEESRNEIERQVEEIIHEAEQRARARPPAGARTNRVMEAVR
ncbi:thiamine pyrophosphate-dependent dehydrogenase E1 component subunit alpha [bacterium]|nr:thiamine pyrophosphate-dependent dehydrogenase E1 component subunit alpha [bacterium]